MYVDSVDIPCLRIYIPIIICLILLKIIPNLLPMKLRPNETGKIWLPTKIDPHDITIQLSRYHS